MQIVLNGQPKEIDPGLSVAHLLEQLGLDRQPCAVELNRDLITKFKHDTQQLHDGDTIEIVTLVGGG